MIQVLLGGLASGAIYGLVAMGFAIVFYVTRVINFATGQLLMVAVMVGGAVATLGWPPIIAVLIGIAAAGALGVVTYLLAVRPVLAVQRIGFAWLVSTLGAALLLQSFAALIWGPTSRPFPRLLVDDSVSVGNAHITVQELVSIGIAFLAIVIVEVVRRRTLFGKVGMAVAEDPDRASAIGINTTRVAIVAFAMGGALAGTGGVLVGPLTFANPYLGDTYGINGFVALMIGGVNRPVGAMVGGLLLGVLVEAASRWIGSQASDWFPFVVVAVVLMAIPQGLFSLRRPARLFRTGRVVTEGAGS
jgi:branched-chain amino acid transport system permease protein